MTARGLGCGEKFTTLTGERWPGAASSLLFGVRALKIMNTNLLPLPLSLSCSHLYAFFLVLSYCLLFVIIAEQKILSLFTCVFTLSIFLETCWDFLKFPILKFWNWGVFCFLYYSLNLFKFHYSTNTLLDNCLFLDFQSFYIRTLLYKIV